MPQAPGGRPLCGPQAARAHHGCQHAILTMAAHQPAARGQRQRAKQISKRHTAGSIGHEQLHTPLRQDIGRHGPGGGGSVAATGQCLHLGAQSGDAGRICYAGASAGFRHWPVTAVQNGEGET